MKKFLILTITLLVALCFAFSTVCFATSYEKPPLDEDPAILQNVICRLMMDDIQKAVEDYYSQYTDYLPTVEVYAPTSSTKITSLTYKASDNSYTVKIEVQPYVTAHNVVGQEEITFEIDASGNVKMVDYHHIKSFEYPPWLDVKLKKPFPENTYNK